MMEREQGWNKNDETPKGEGFKQSNGESYPFAGFEPGPTNGA